VRPVGVEERGRGAQSARLNGARRPLAVRENAVEPAVGGVEERARVGDAAGVALAGLRSASPTIFCIGVMT
jgi:hypothetical protein